ncbi:nitrogen regulation protein NR(II) [Gemmatimonadota bacterium]
MTILARPGSVRFVQGLRFAVVVVLAAGIWIFLRDNYGSDAFLVVDIPLIFLLVANVLTTIWLLQQLWRSGTLTEDQLYSQVFLDVLAMGLVVFYTGASDSDQALIMLLPVMLASAYLYLRGSLFAASLSVVIIAALYWLDANGWLQNYGAIYNQNSIIHDAGVLTDLVLRWFIIALALFTAASISGFIAQNQIGIMRELGDLTRRLERFRLNTADVLGNIDSGIVTVDADGSIIFMNRAALEILQYHGPNPERRQYTLVLSGGLEPLSPFISDPLTGGPAERRNEVIITSGNGAEIPLGISTTILRGNEGVRGVVLIFQDITEAKLLDEKIRRQDKLAVTGELAAGIAHELKNPLASLSGSAEVLRESLKPEGEDGRLLDLVVRESYRINESIEKFLDYSRIQQSAIRPLSLRALFEEVAALARNHPSCVEGRDVQVQLDAEALILADDGQMKQVFLNLVLNGLEALVDSGTVTLKLPPDEERKMVDEKLVEIWVQDSGPGVSVEEVSNIFEPFYTSKRGGHGLGLAVVMRIVESHDGYIVFEPDSDGTSTFRVFLPGGEMGL